MDVINISEWILCPACGGKTRDKIRTDTVLINYPLYCPKCKQEVLIEATIEYELLNRERKTEKKKMRVAAYCRVSTDNEDQAIHLKVSSDILSNILSIIPIGSFMKYSQMRAFLVRTQKSVSSLIV